MDMPALISTAPGLSSEELGYKIFCNYIEEICGIKITEDRFYIVKSRLKSILRKVKVGTPNELLKRIRDGDEVLKSQVIDAMTIHETSWFRDRYPFAYLKENLFAAISKNKQEVLRIWSTACSYGPEPYSISILIQEYLQEHCDSLPRSVQVIGTDVSTYAIKQARSGEYTRLEMSRGLTEYYKKKYFLPTENGYRVKDIIKGRVHFHVMNLLEDYTLLGKFDIIFCRNVLIYFHAEKKKQILEKIANSLVPNGYLLLGASEFILNLDDRFKAVNYKEGTAYQLLC